MGSMSMMHWAIVGGVVILLFGKNIVSRFMGDMGATVKEAKNALKEISADDYKDKI